MAKARRMRVGTRDIVFSDGRWDSKIKIFFSVVFKENLGNFILAQAHFKAGLIIFFSDFLEFCWLLVSF